jgi:ADP-ribose pyrophosphatase YjhB (NUDIX family)
MAKNRRVVLFALIKDNKILLEQRQLKGFSEIGHFIPGGAIELTENIEKALIREIHEELGVTPIDFKVLTENYLDGIGNNILMPYIVTSWQGDIPNFILDKNDPLVWIEIDNALPLLPKEASGEIIKAIKIHLDLTKNYSP